MFIAIYTTVIKNSYSLAMFMPLIAYTTLRKYIAMANDCNNISNVTAVLDSFIAVAMDGYMICLSLSSIYF